MRRSSSGSTSRTSTPRGRFCCGWSCPWAPASRPAAACPDGSWPRTPRTRGSWRCLVTARLVTSDGKTVELAHESLARASPRQRRWLLADTEGQLILRHLTMAADCREALGCPNGELYREPSADARLARAHPGRPHRGRAGLPRRERDPGTNGGPLWGSALDGSRVFTANATARWSTGSPRAPRPRGRAWTPRPVRSSGRPRRLRAAAGGTGHHGERRSSAALWTPRVTCTP